MRKSGHAPESRHTRRQSLGSPSLFSFFFSSMASCVGGVGGVVRRCVGWIEYR